MFIILYSSNNIYKYLYLLIIQKSIFLPFDTENLIPSIYFNNLVILEIWHLLIV